MVPSQLTSFAHAAAVARLSTSAAQRVFRSLADALAHPGRIEHLETIDALPVALLPLLALCDLETSISVLGDAPGLEDWESFTAAMTGAQRTTVEMADWIAVLDSEEAAIALSAGTGSPEAPETAARLVITVAGIDEDIALGSGAEALHVGMSGPGVPGRRSVVVNGLAPEVLFRLDAANRRYPAGLDTWLVDPLGRIVGLPRSVRLDIGTIVGGV